MMRRARLLVATMAVLALSSFLPQQGEAAQPTQTKRRAELNILRSPMFFWQAGLHRLIRSQTRTFRTNVTVTCGRRLSPSTRAHVFFCILRYRVDRIRLRYTAVSATAFRLKILSV
jgi:hypothetical protein